MHGLQGQPNGERLFGATSEWSGRIAAKTFELIKKAYEMVYVVRKHREQCAFIVAFGIDYKQRVVCLLL